MSIRIHIARSPSFRQLSRERIFVSSLGVVACALALAGCPNESASTTKGPVEFTLAGSSEINNGERLARCAERALQIHFMLKKQEFGDPWRETDTIVGYSASRSDFSVVFVGGNKTVDGTKERVEARLPAIMAAFASCERRYGARDGVATDNLHVRYMHVDRSKGDVTDVIVWESGKFDFPSSAAVTTVDAFLDEMR